MEYAPIGRITGTHGLDGRLSLTHTLPKNTFRKLSHIFIEIKKQSYIPYFIEEQKEIATGTALVRLDETTSVEAAKALTGKDIYIESALLLKLNPHSITGNLTGFTVTDAAYGYLGQVEQLFETPGQVLATINYKGREVIIPLIDSTIQDINMAAKSIRVTLPEGLLDVYLD